MIKSIGQGASVAVETARLRESAKAASSAKATASVERGTSSSVSSTVSRMAGEGAPIDSARIERVKTAIASGDYPVDAERIASKMLDLDLPVVKH